MSSAQIGRGSHRYPAGWRARRAEELAVVVTTAWFARPFIRPGRYVTGFDTSTYSGPNLHFTLGELLHGRLPLWNDTIFGGAPHLGNTQTGALYLPKLLFAGMNLNRAMSLLVAAHLLGLALGLLVLMRRLGCRPPAGFITALAGVGCGAILTRSIQFEQILVIAWAPAVLVAIHAVMTSPRAWRAAGVAALVFAGAVLAGHPQMTYLVGALAAMWTVGVTIATRAWRRLGHLAAAGTAAGLLCGLQLLATRAATQSSAIVGGRSLATLRLPDRSIEPGRMAQVLLGTVRAIDPGYNAGAFETVGYVGAAVVALALVGVVTNLRPGPRRPLVVCLSVLAIVTAILATGSRTALFQLFFDHLPGFDLMRVSGRWITVTDLCLAILAGLGVDGGRQALRRDSRLRAPLAAIGAGAVVVAVLALTDRVAVDRMAVLGWLVGTGLVAAGLVAAGFVAARRGDAPDRRPNPAALVVAARHDAPDRRPNPAALVVAARHDAPDMRRNPAALLVAAFALLGTGFELGVANRHSVNLGLAAGVSFTNYTSAPTEWLKGEPGWTLALTGDRIGDTQYLLPGLRPNANTLFDIRSIDGYDGGVQVSKRWLAMVGSFTSPVAANFELTMRAQMPDHLEPAALARLGVRWVLIDTDDAAGRLAGWRGPVVTGGLLEVYENPTWIGEAVVRRPGSADVAQPLVRRSPGELEASVGTDQPGRLVVTSQWDPGWRATIDGNPVDTQVVDRFLLGADVPAGNHVVRFIYRPDWVLPGLMIMLLGAALVVAMFVADHRRRGTVRPSPR